MPDPPAAAQEGGGGAPAATSMGSVQAPIGKEPFWVRRGTFFLKRQRLLTR